MIIDVKYELGDSVKNSVNGDNYVVIGYNYVLGGVLKYICNDGKDWVYKYDFEIKGKQQEHEIGFVKNNDSPKNDN